MPDIITLQHRQKRFPFSDVITEVKVQVNPKLCYPEYNLISGTELSRFCFIQNFREQGRDIGARNPYDDSGNTVHSEPYSSKRGTNNAYIVSSDPNDWHKIS